MLGNQILTTSLYFNRFSVSYRSLTKWIETKLIIISENCYALARAAKRIGLFDDMTKDNLSENDVEVILNIRESSSRT